MKQFVYAITVGDKTKIGMSKQPEIRIDTLLREGGTSRDDAKITIIDVKNMRACEAACHLDLAEHRHVGEWFFVCHETAVGVINDHRLIGRDIASRRKPSWAELECNAKIMFNRKYKLDTSTAVYELSKDGDFDEAIAEVIVAAAYCDSEIYTTPMIGRKACHDEKVALNAMFSFLEMVSLNLRASGKTVMERLPVICRTNTDAAVMAAIAGMNRMEMAHVH